MLFEYDGALVHLRAESGTSSVITDAAALAAYKAGFPMVPARGSLTCRAILDGEIVHIRDLAAEPGISRAVLDLGHRSQVSIPLMRDGRAIGAISAGSMQIDGISDSQVALLQTFAEQAVIAIGSAETYRALQTRTADLQESLEYQTATSDVLKTISRAAFDLQPVLETLVRTAARLCDADMAVIDHPEGESLAVGRELRVSAGIRGLLPDERGKSDVNWARRVSERERCAKRSPCIFTTWPPFRATRMRRSGSPDSGPRSACRCCMKAR